MTDSERERLRALHKVRVRLLQMKTWRYLRYLHAREAMKLIRPDASVLVVGAGYGVAEIALALEFHEMEFRLTDWEGASHGFKLARELAGAFDVRNVSFDVFNVLTSRTGRADVVYSVEMLEHIDDDARAAESMRGHARSHIFCLVPFADKGSAAREDLQQRAWTQCEHYRVGYDREALAQLFPNPVAIRGCYWTDAGLELRRRLTELDPTDIREQANDLMVQASQDVRDALPKHIREAGGIWTLAAA